MSDRAMSSGGRHSVDVGGLAGLAALLLAAGCATTAPVPGGPTRELVMAYDDARASGAVAFPDRHLRERGALPAPRRRAPAVAAALQAESPGSVEINIYGSTLLETPGEAIRTLKRELSKDDLSDGKDGRWVVEDLVDLKPLKGIVWVGVHRVGGTPQHLGQQRRLGAGVRAQQRPHQPDGPPADQAHAHDPPRAGPLDSPEVRVRRRR